MKINKKVMIWGCLSIAFLVFCYITLLPKDKTIAMSLNKAETNFKQVNEVSNDSDDPMQNLYSFAFQIDDEMVQLPIDLPDFIHSGWQDKKPIPTDPFEFIPLDHQTFYKNDIALNVYFNASEEFPDSMDQYYLTNVSLAAQDYKKHNVVLPKGIKLGKSSEKEIIEAYGEPSETLEDFDEEERYGLLYRYDSKQNILLIMNKAETLDEIYLSYEKALKKTELPAILKNEQPLLSLPETLSANAVGIDGALYNLPTSMSSFVAQGWQVEEDTIIPSDQLQAKKYRLKKGDNTLVVGVKNYSSLPADIKDCHVVSVEFSSDEPYEILLPAHLEQYQSIDDIRTLAAPFKVLDAYFGGEEEDKHLDFIRIKTSDRSQIQINVDYDNQQKPRYYVLTNYPK